MDTPTLHLDAIEPFDDAVGDEQLADLATRLLDDGQSPEAIESTLTLVLSLNGDDTLALLERVRKTSLERLDDAFYQAYYEENEARIGAFVRALNEKSLDAHGVPFLLAAARGELTGAADLMAEHGLTVEAFLPEAIDATPRTPSEASARRDGPRRAPEPRRDEARPESAWWCPELHAFRTVGLQFWPPWGHMWCWHMDTRRPGKGEPCGLRHGGFGRAIRGWWSWAGLYHLMVLVNGNGYRLRARTDDLFYKTWTVFVFGLTPFGVMINLQAVRY